MTRVKGGWRQPLPLVGSLLCHIYDLMASYVAMRSAQTVVKLCSLQRSLLVCLSRVPFIPPFTVIGKEHGEIEAASRAISVS